MARERSRRQPHESRWPSVPGPILDPIGRLDDVMATLEEMLDHHRVPPAAPSRGAAGPEEPRDSRDPGAFGRGPRRARRRSRCSGTWWRPPPTARRREPAASPRRPGRRRRTSQRRRLRRRPIGSPCRPGSRSFRTSPSRASAISTSTSIPGGPVLAASGTATRRLRRSTPRSTATLIDRLENEIDVIVQAGAEEAMQRAAADIAARVREHVAITLPEVIEELVRMSSRAARLSPFGSRRIRLVSPSFGSQAKPAWKRPTTPTVSRAARTPPGKRAAGSPRAAAAGRTAS